MPRLGIGLSTTAVRAVLAEQGRVLWRASRPLGDAGQLGDALVALLRAVPRRRFRSLSVIAAVSPATCQVKKLSGLPATLGRPEVEQLLTTNAQRFFLSAGSALSLPVVYRNGAWWGAVFHGSVIDEIERACGAAGVRYLGCVPAVTAMAALCRAGHVQCQDGSSRLSLAIADGEWIDVRRDRQPSTESGTGELGELDGIRQLGDDADDYATAYAAARADIRPPLLLPSSTTNPVARRVRLALLAILCLAAAVLAAAGPGIRASRQLSRDEARLAALTTSARAWRSALDRSSRTTAALEEVVRFTREQRPIVRLLAEVTRALPESTAIVSLRIDTAAVSATVISSNAAAVAAKFTGVTTVDDARIVGALTRENVNGAQLQRATVRLRLKRAPAIGATR